MIYISGEHYESIQYVADKFYTKGSPVKLQGFIIGSVFNTVQEGELCALVYYSNKAKVKKNNGLNFLQGQPIYYDILNKIATNDNSFDLIGFCISDSILNDNEVIIEFDGKYKLSQSSQELNFYKEKITILEEIQSGEIIRTDTSGVKYAISGNIANLGDSSIDFVSNNKVNFLIGGMVAEKGTEIIWQSSHSFSVNRILDISEVVTIKFNN